MSSGFWKRNRFCLAAEQAAIVPVAIKMIRKDIGDHRDVRGPLDHRRLIQHER